MGYGRWRTRCWLPGGVKAHCNERGTGIGYNEAVKQARQSLAGA
jgi:hypothetical protein